MFDLRSCVYQFLDTLEKAKQDPKLFDALQPIPTAQNHWPRFGLNI